MECRRWHLSGHCTNDSDKIYYEMLSPMRLLIFDRYSVILASKISWWPGNADCDFSGFKHSFTCDKQALLVSLYNWDETWLGVGNWQKLPRVLSHRNAMPRPVASGLHGVARQHAPSHDYGTLGLISNWSRHQVPQGIACHSQRENSEGKYKMLLFINTIGDFSILHRP